MIARCEWCVGSEDDSGALVLVTADAPRTEDVPTIGDDNVGDEVDFEEAAAEDDRVLKPEVLEELDAEELSAPNAADVGEDAGEA